MERLWEANGFVTFINDNVVSVPFPLRWLFASEPRVLSRALEVVTRAISTYLVKKAGFTHKTAKTGALTEIHYLPAHLKHHESCFEKSYRQLAFELML
jgi:hypothetical protein